MRKIIIIIVSQLNCFHLIAHIARVRRISKLDNIQWIWNVMAFQSESFPISSSIMWALSLLQKKDFVLFCFDLFAAEVSYINHQHKEFAPIFKQKSKSMA